LEKKRYIIGIFLSILVIFLGLIEPMNKQKNSREMNVCLFYDGRRSQLEPRMNGS